MAGEWIWRAFNSQNETVKKGVILTLQAIAVGMVWFWGRRRKAENAKKRRRYVHHRGKLGNEWYETPANSPRKPVVVNPFKTPSKTPSKTPVRSAVKSPLSSVLKSAVKSPLSSALKSPLSSLLLTPVNSLKASISALREPKSPQEGPIRRLFQSEAEESEDWWNEESEELAENEGQGEQRYAVDSEDALSVSDEEIRRILDDE